MKKISITNINGRSFEAILEEQEALQWVEEQKALNSWGLPERTISEWSGEYDEEGKPIFVDVVYPCEYVITIEDFVVPNREKRAEEYKKRTDHLAVEALRKRFVLGEECEEWQTYISEINAIKTEFPD